MSYNTQARIAENVDLQKRIAACAATQNVRDPYNWSAQRMWEFSATPGWADAYASAIESGVVSPGSDEAVITDLDILAAVQTLLSSTLESGEE